MSRKETDFYNQCVLVRAGVSERSVQVSWIPTKYAAVGRTISLKDSRGEWNDWVVESASQPKDAESVEENSDRWRDYIKRTDI
jgi:hypothetical protein